MSFLVWKAVKTRRLSMKSEPCQSLLLSCMRRFTTKGEQTLLHFSEKLLTTAAIYLLNKYNKAWLWNLATVNLGLRKVPGIVSKILRKKIALIHGNCITFAYFQTLRPRKRGFLHETGFLRGYKFSTSHFIDNSNYTRAAKRPTCIIGIIFHKHRSKYMRIN